MIWLLTRSIVWPVKAGAGSAKLGYKTGRLFGYRRIFVFGLGVAVGLLLAPMTGAALRDKIRDLVDGGLSTDPLPADAATDPSFSASDNAENRAETYPERRL